jgi:hypothetical protein
MIARGMSKTTIAALAPDPLPGGARRVPRQRQHGIAHTALATIRIGPDRLV